MKDYLMNLFPEDARSREIIFSHLEKNRHNSTSTDVTLIELKKVLEELLKDFDRGSLDYMDLAVVCDKLDILMRDVSGYRESRSSMLITELADIDWALKNKSINPREYIKQILSRYS